MSEWITFSVVALCCVVGAMVTALRLPGTWLIVATGAGYLWYAGWPAQTATVLAILCGAAVLGEVIELLVGVVLAKRAGASRYASWGGVAGGFLGAIFLSFIPIFPIGTIVGALLGCFLGAAMVELAAQKRLAQGTRVGVWSAVGFAIGMATKVGVAMAMSAILLVAAWPRTH